MNISFSTPRTVQTKEMKPWQGVLFGLVFVVVGIALLLFAVSTIKTYNEKNKTFVETTSKVVDYNYNDEGLQAIVVEYVVDGQTYRKESNTYSNMPKSVGTEVSIKYNPNNPKDAIWTSDSTNIVLPIAGAVFSLAGIVMVITSIKKGKNQKTLDGQGSEQENGLSNNINVQSQINNVDQSQLSNMNQQIPSGDINGSNQQNNDVNINNPWGN